MAELDELLRDSFARIAETDAPARDSAGVADAIRARVASGDTGAPAMGRVAPGWGGVGTAGWIGAIGVVAAVGVLGAALGASGAFGRPVLEQAVGTDAALVASADAHACAGGEVVGSIPAGTRVLAIARSDDAGWLGVRDPATLLGTLWLPASVVAGDAGGAWDALPLGGACPDVYVEPVDPVEPDPAPTDEPEPGPNPGPGPGPNPSPQPGDTTPPAIDQWWATPTLIYDDQTATVFALASDNVGVTGVAISWTGAKSGSGEMTKVGSEWRFSLTNTPATSGSVTFTMLARDAAGNLGAPRTQTVTLSVLG